MREVRPIFAVLPLDIPSLSYCARAAAFRSPIGGDCSHGCARAVAFRSAIGGDTRTAVAGVLRCRSALEIAVAALAQYR